MKVETTSLPGVLLIAPRVFSDTRGQFLETYNEPRYREAGVASPFVQDNVSYSRANVLRGLHLQQPDAQTKLVSVLEGEIFDVAADVRIGSPTFGKWTAARLSSTNHHQLFIPEGFAHGFAVLSDTAVVHYKCSRLYSPESELTIRWDDEQLAIDWPIENPIVSEKDAAGLKVSTILRDRLPRFVD